MALKITMKKSLIGCKQNQIDTAKNLRPQTAGRRQYPAGKPGHPGQGPRDLAPGDRGTGRLKEDFANEAARTLTRARRCHRGQAQGQGIGSGNGKTAGKGHKGQNARSGGGVRPGFEGGQMPLQRRIPKRGFNNIFAKQYTSVNVEVLSRFEDGQVVTADTLREAGIIKKGTGWDQNTRQRRDRQEVDRLRREVHRVG